MTQPSTNQYLLCLSTSLLTTESFPLIAMTPISDQVVSPVIVVKGSRENILGVWQDDNSVLIHDAPQPQQREEEEISPSSTSRNNTTNNKPRERFFPREASVRRRRRLPSLKRPSIIGQSLRRLLGSSSSRGHSLRGLDSKRIEQEQLQWMLHQLADEELEIAARSSYKYLILSFNSNNNNSNSDQQIDAVVQKAYAEQFCLKFLQSKKGNAKAALTKLQATLQFRKEMDLDRLRLAFHHRDDGDDDSDDSSYRQTLEQQLQDGIVWVQGYDKDGRATYIFRPRNVQGHGNEEWILKQHIYTLERAIACSRAADQTVNVVVDFEGFSATQHAPPTHVGKQFMLTLRNHYAGSVHQIFLLHAPFSFHALWAIFKPFAGSQTRHKIHFCKAPKRHKNSNNSNELEKWYVPAQAASWMMAGGTKNRLLDVYEYLHKIPFDRAFDE